MDVGDLGDYNSSPCTSYKQAKNSKSCGHVGGGDGTASNFGS